MFIKQAYNDASIQYTGGIEFVSLITDGLVAGGRRSEYNSLYRIPIDRQCYVEWQSKIPYDWEEDDTWSVISAIHAPQRPPTDEAVGVPFAIELVKDKMIIKVRNDNGTEWLYNKPMIKDEWLKFRLEARWSVKNSGYVRLYINGAQEVDYDGPCYFSGIEGDNVTFQCGVYVALKSKVTKRVMWHRV